MYKPTELTAYTKKYNCFHIHFNASSLATFCLGRYCPLPVVGVYGLSIASLSHSLFGFFWYIALGSHLIGLRL